MRDRDYKKGDVIVGVKTGQCICQEGPCALDLVMLTGVD